MYTNNAYLNDSHIDRKDKSNPLMVTMCGTYKLYTKPNFLHGDPVAELTFNYYTLLPGKLIFILIRMVLIPLYMLVIWFYIAPKNLKICLLCQGSHRSILGSLYWKQCHKSTSFLWHNQR